MNPHRRSASHQARVPQGRTGEPRCATDYMNLSMQPSTKHSYCGRADRRLSPKSTIQWLAMIFSGEQCIENEAAETIAQSTCFCKWLFLKYSEMWNESGRECMSPSAVARPSQRTGCRGSAHQLQATKSTPKTKDQNRISEPLVH